MREIKFRAWDKKNKRMEYSFCVGANGRVFGVEINMCESRVQNIDLTDFLELMQYTGLKDKNGKEGYFDDLVKWGKAIYKVVWNEEEGIAALQYVSGREVFKYLRISQIKRGEIIGNIWEQPELFEGE